MTDGVSKMPTGWFRSMVKEAKFITARTSTTMRRPWRLDSLKTALTRPQQFGTGKTRSSWLKILSSPWQTSILQLPSPRVITQSWLVPPPQSLASQSRCLHSPASVRQQKQLKTKTNSCAPEHEVLALFQPNGSNLSVEPKQANSFFTKITRKHKISILLISLVFNK